MNPSAKVQLLAGFGPAARAAARALAAAAPSRIDQGLAAMAARLRADAAAILAANRADLDRARGDGASSAFLDRLALDDRRLAGVAAGLETIAARPTPLGRVLDCWTRPDGLSFERVSTPLGVIAVIYESRPNVTADAAALALKAGNAVILRSGSAAFATCRAIHAALMAGWAETGLPEAAVQFVPVTDRAAVGELLAGLDGAIDVIVPRGGKDLVARVQAEARAPVFAHLDGVCHVYLHASADPEMAVAVTLNAKMRRTGVCGAAETLLVDRAALGLLPAVADALRAAGCALRGDPEAQAAAGPMEPASAADWPAEYLDAILAVRVVDDLEAAMAHIARYGSGHTETIIAREDAAAERFLAEVDSAIVMRNASTQFADGGEFGFGGEIGIATGRLHARGPVGAEQLTSFKYVVRGAGHVRP